MSTVLELASNRSRSHSRYTCVCVCVCGVLSQVLKSLNNTHTFFICTGQTLKQKSGGMQVKTCLCASSSLGQFGDDPD